MSKIFQRDYIIKLLRREGVLEYKIFHSLVVADLALMIADEVEKEGLSVDKKIVEAGALLHDLGTSRTTDDLTPNHCAIGGRLARQYGYPEKVARAIEAHEGIVTKEEARKLGVEMGRDNFVPQSWEEKIVLYADHVVVVVAECCREDEFWKDPKCTQKAVLPYWKEVFKRFSAGGVNASHPLLQREYTIHQEMKKYVKPGFFERLRGPIKRTQEEQRKFGLKIPFPYMKCLLE